MGDTPKGQVQNKAQPWKRSENETKSRNNSPYNWAENHQDRMLNLLKTGVGSDLTLLIGPEKTPMKVHSLILMAGSKTFQNRLDINQELTEGALPPFKSTVQELRLEDEDPEIFTLFLEELYTGNCGVKITQAIPLLKVATDYGVNDLIRKCSLLLQGKLDNDNVIIIFSQAMQCFNKELIEPSLKHICKNASAILMTKGFANLRLECLIEILKQDDLTVKNEMEVFAIPYRWGEAECKRQKLDPLDSKDMRKVIKKALAYIRFPNMRQAEFALNVATKSILDEGELMSLMISFMVPASDRSQLSSGRFISTPRVYTETRSSEVDGPKCYVSRLGPPDQSSSFTARNPKYLAKPGCFTETLLFSLSHEAKFCGIKIAKKMFCFYETAYPEQFSYKFDGISLTITLSKALHGYQFQPVHVNKTANIHYQQYSKGHFDVMDEEQVDATQIIDLGGMFEGHFDVMDEEQFDALHEHKLAEKTKQFDYEVCVDAEINLEASKLYKIRLSYSGPIEYKRIQFANPIQQYFGSSSYQQSYQQSSQSYQQSSQSYQRPTNFTLADSTVKSSSAYPLHVETGYNSSQSFTARNSLGELQTIKVDFSRESGDTKMAINEGFIEKLIFQVD